MPAVTVRKLSAETHRALKSRAQKHGRSTEAEIRAILDESVAGSLAPRIGTALTSLGQCFHDVEIEFERDPTPAEPVRFE